MNQIITSLLDNDAYKFSMGQAIFHQYNNYTTTWTFKCRNKNVEFTPTMVREITYQIKAYCNLFFKESELDYLRSIKWIKDDYIDYLRLWRPRYQDFTINTDSDCGLNIETNGTWLNTSMYEVPVLAIVNEVYFKFQDNYNELRESYFNRLENKIVALEKDIDNIGTFSEFGTRRRFSKVTQDFAVSELSSRKLGWSNFIGTSNMYLAKKYGVTPVGTMAHEWIMCAGQGNHKHNPAYSNWYALNSWVKEYGVLNGIALTDTITTDCFLKDF